MLEKILDCDVEIVKNQNFYKWAKFWGKIQKNYYKTSVYLRREKQIEDFVCLNEFKQVYVEKDTDILKNIKSVPHPSQADLVIITDQKFSRLPCVGIIERIEKLLTQCPNLFVCLNRHYINIDNAYNDATLDLNFNLAITQWLKNKLTHAHLIDLSLDYLDSGNYFTWVIPDRMYYIKQCT